MKTASDQYRLLFEQHLIHSNIKDITLQAYLHDLDQFLYWTQEMKLDIDRVTKVEAALFIEYLNSPVHELRPGQIGAYSSSTIQRKIKTLQKFYDFIQEIE